MRTARDQPLGISGYVKIYYLYYDYCFSDNIDNIFVDSHFSSR